MSGTEELFVAVEAGSAFADAATGLWEAFGGFSHKRTGGSLTNVVRKRRRKGGHTRKRNRKRKIRDTIKQNLKKAKRTKPHNRNSANQFLTTRSKRLAMPKRRRNVRRRSRRRTRRRGRRRSSRKLAISRAPVPKSIIKRFTQTTSFQINPTAGNVAYKFLSYNTPGNMHQAANLSIIQPRGWDLWQTLFNSYFCFRTKMSWIASYVDNATDTEAHQRHIIFGVLELNDQTIQAGTVGPVSGGNYVPEEFPCKKRYGALSGLGHSRGTFVSRPGSPHGMKAKISPDQTVWCGTTDGDIATQPTKRSFHCFFAHGINDATHDMGTLNVQITYTYDVKMFGRKDATLVQSND